VLHKLNLAATLLFLCCALRGASVTTAQFGNTRTGANTSESLFVPGNAARISKLGTYAVDGFVYGQPLVVDGVNILGATRVLVTATMHNSIYAFDARRPSTAYLWTRNIGTSLLTHPNMADNFLYQAEVGCLPTPVIDPAAGTSGVIYAVCVVTGGTWSIYSLNLADGTNFHAPVAIAGSNNGVTFDPIRHMARSALGLVNGVLNVAFCGWGDEAPYQGWVFTYDSTTLTQTGVWSDTSSSNGEGGIWLSGGGLASDGTYLYVSTGNGDFTANNYGTSFVRLSAAAAPLDYGTPADWATINATDKDLASGHVFVTGDYMIGGGKDGRIFVLDKSGATTMGQLQGVGAGPHQVSNLANGAIFGCTIFANNSLITAALNTTMKRFTWDAVTGLFDTTPVGISVGTYFSPGPGCSYTSNGSDTSTALLWGVVPTASAFSAAKAGVLIVWNALTLSEIYRSDTIVGDTLGTYAKFAMPTPINGRVFVPTFSNVIAVYGFANQSSMDLTGGMSVSGGFTLH
jgi:hypothetical protein